jgi:hypothetical protein
MDSLGGARQLMRTWPALLTLLLALPAAAVPRFAARTGLPCSACHVNPSGGGMRSRYGRDTFARTELSTVRSTDAFAIDPRIGDRLALGADLRFAVLHQRRHAPDDAELQDPSLLREASQQTTFFPMQMDLYTEASLHEHLALYADIGAAGSYEVFALVRNLPLRGYFKAGMFVPPYGTRLADHTASIRERMGFDPRGKDAGVEVGIEPGPLTLQLSLQNGEALGSPQDTIPGKLIAARAAVRLKLGPLVASPGASVLRVSERVEGEDGTDLRYGPFLWLGLGRLSYLGEVGIRDQDATGKTLYVFYQELGVRVWRGQELYGTVEFLDPDVDVADGDATYRVGAGLEIYPVPMGEIDLIGRRYFARGDRREDGLHEMLAMLHLYF